MEPKKQSDKGGRSASRKKDNIKISNMKALALLVKEIVREGNKGQKGSKSGIENPITKAADKIIKGLDSANCKIEFYLKAYRKPIYEEMRKKILASYSDPEWMSSATIKAHLGDPSIGAYLHISVAMNTAIKLRNAIHGKKYKNPNDREEAMMHYHCYYPSLLHYRFLVVMLDALGEDHDDARKIQDLISKFKSESGLADSDASSSEDGSGEGDSIAKTFASITGERHSTKDIERTVSNIMGSKDAFEKVKDVFTKASATDGNPLENKELLTDTVSAVAPMFNDMFKNFSNSMGKKKESSTSSTEESGSDSD